MSSYSPATIMSRMAIGPQRRTFLHLAAATVLTAPGRSLAQQRRFTIGFANLSDDPGARIEGLGFTGEDVRSSFVLGARGLPIELLLYDNARERAKSIANAEDAVRRKVDLYIQYGDDPATNEEVGRRMAAARIPVLAVNQPVGNAPLYATDNREAGRLAGDALGKFALTTWRVCSMAAGRLKPFSLGDLLNRDVNWSLTRPISIRSCGRRGPDRLGATVPRSRRTTLL